jgi:hypothetical protein
MSVTADVCITMHGDGASRLGFSGAGHLQHRGCAVTDGGWNSDGPARVSWAGVSAVVSARRPDRTRHGRRGFDIGDDEQV